MNQNLNVEIDLTAINAAIKAKQVVPHEWVDARGNKHHSLTLFVTARLKQDGKNTHSVTIKNADSWKPVSDAEGKTLFFGSANPSKYQPEDNNNAEGVDSDYQINV